MTHYFNTYNHSKEETNKRYGKEDISGLKTKPGQGRKPIMDSSDEPLVRDAVSRDRQSVKAAKASWEETSGKRAYLCDQLQQCGLNT